MRTYVATAALCGSLLCGVTAESESSAVSHARAELEGCPADKVVGLGYSGDWASTQVSFYDAFGDAVESKAVNALCVMRDGCTTATVVVDSVTDAPEAQRFEVAMASSSAASSVQISSLTESTQLFTFCVSYGEVSFDAASMAPDVEPLTAADINSRRLQGGSFSFSYDADFSFSYLESYSYESYSYYVVYSYEPLSYSYSFAPSYSYVPEDIYSYVQSYDAFSYDVESVFVEFDGEVGLIFCNETFTFTATNEPVFDSFPELNAAGIIKQAVTAGMNEAFGDFATNRKEFTSSTANNLVGSTYWNASKVVFSPYTGNVTGLCNDDRPRFNVDPTNPDLVPGKIPVYATIGFVFTPQNETMLEAEAETVFTKFIEFFDSGVDSDGDGFDDRRLNTNVEKLLSADPSRRLALHQLALGTETKSQNLFCKAFTDALPGQGCDLAEAELLFIAGTVEATDDTAVPTGMPTPLPTAIPTPMPTAIPTMAPTDIQVNTIFEFACDNNKNVYGHRFSKDACQLIKSDIINVQD